MGRKKYEIVKSVKFTGSDDPARIILEKMERQKGKDFNFNRWIKELIIFCNSGVPEHKDVLIQILKENYIRVIRNISALSIIKENITDELMGLGVEDISPLHEFAMRGSD